MHTQLNVCEKKELPCFLYLIQIFVVHYTTAQSVKQDSAHCDMNINIYFGLVIRSRKRENVFWIAKVPLRFK